ncbi:hypothetical protein DPV99_09810 [Aggregatibacter aphrophilus]|jgi:putative lipoprotein|uniref:hypothetical protein n=1 Tax=Aggregatibacter kilianii TaxID=2025884 RepID=UPI000DAB9055|nr:hypothetical protein [Aggregatibacter kilianii]RDF00202.1 hypothetical protein DPV99_09810 [Aggregatibacter aphrophilus]
MILTLNYLFVTIKKLGIFLIGLLFLAACGNNVNKLADESLGEIKLNQEYGYVIDLDKLANGKAIETSVRVNINTTNSGIKADYQLTENRDETKNQVIISGKPTVKGDISVDIQWGIYGNMSYSPKLFKKRFIINVVE